MSSPYSPIMSDALVSPDQKCFFNNLPAELHLMIWEFCMPPARHIRLGFPQDPAARLIDGCIPANIHDLAPSQLPILFHINRSSRTFALQNFVLGFGHTPSEFDKTYWNPKIDTIYIPPFNPEDENTTSHFQQYQRQDELAEEVIERKFFQGFLRAYRFPMLALDKIQHLALPFPDNSMNEFVDHDDEDFYCKDGILFPREGRQRLCPTTGQLNWGIDRKIAFCKNLKTLTWVGDASMFSGKSKWGTPTIREVDSEEKVDKKFLRQKKAIDFVTGEGVKLTAYGQFLESFETYVDVVKLNSKAMREWEMPRLRVGMLEFEKERVVNEFCVEPMLMEEGNEEEEEEDEDSDYDSDYLSNDSIE